MIGYGKDEYTIDFLCISEIDCNNNCISQSSQCAIMYKNHSQLFNTWF